MKTDAMEYGITDEEVDLLVCGDLEESRREHLLTRLDGEEGGWKKCALAFLEAQMWKEAMEGETVACARSRKRGWSAPLSAMAAALMGFVLAWVLLPKKEVPLVERGAPVVQPEEIIRYIPYPVERGIGLVPVSDERGGIYYTTRRPLPEVFVEAFEQAGHQVKQIERTVSLPTGEKDEPLELPVTETRILISHQL